MAIWEYKVITSGKGGFASPGLLEKFLNDLGKEEWEIIAFRAQPDNALAFSGLARRPTQRDWTLEDAAAAAVKVEADKLRAEFEAKFKGTGAGPAGATEEKPESLADEKAATDDGLRRLRDTDSDLDPDAPEEADEWDKLGAQDELPTFFEAIRPHMRRNQRGPGMAVGIDFLAKKWGLGEEEVKGAVLECGFKLPEDEDDRPDYLEYDGDLYWLNVNRRGELWINTKEKPRPIFRTVPATRVAVEEEPKGEDRKRRPESQGQKPENSPLTRTEAVASETPEAASLPAAAPGGSVVLPAGAELLEKIRPLMRRNRRGPGGSGSTSFLSRALKCSEADLMAAFAVSGLVVPAMPADKPATIEINGTVWWLNKDQRGGVWINGEEKSEGGGPVVAEGPVGLPSQKPAESSPESVATGAVASGGAPDRGQMLAGVRLLLKETKTGAVAGRVDRLAGELGKSPADLIGALTAAGLKVPEKAREKPVFVEHAGEILWLNRNAKDELWLNAKASKFADKSGGATVAGDRGEKKPAGRGGRSRKKPD